jgi:hypothetical protein
MKESRWGCSSVGRVPPWRGGGRGFDSRQLHHIYLLNKGGTTGNLVPCNSFTITGDGFFYFKGEQLDERDI